MIVGQRAENVVDIVGRMDAASAPQLKQEIDALFDQGRYRIVLDLAQLEYIASPGLRVLIEARKPGRSALPVLSRGPVDPASGRDRGVVVEPSLLPPFPTIERVLPPNDEPAAVLGETVRLSGHHLDGTAAVAPHGCTRTPAGGRHASSPPAFVRPAVPPA